MAFVETTKSKNDRGGGGDGCDWDGYCDWDGVVSGCVGDNAGVELSLV